MPAFSLPPARTALGNFRRLRRAIWGCFWGRRKQTLPESRFRSAPGRNAYKDAPATQLLFLLFREGSRRFDAGSGGSAQPGARAGVVSGRLGPGGQRRIQPRTTQRLRLFRAS